MGGFGWFIVGAILGAIGAFIYYRRHVKEVEENLAHAVIAREKAVEAFNALKSKIGG